MVAVEDPYASCQSPMTTSHAGEMLAVGALRMLVASIDDVLVTKLLAISEHLPLPSGCWPRSSTSSRSVRAVIVVLFARVPAAREPCDPDRSSTGEQCSSRRSRCLCILIGAVFAGVIGAIEAPPGVELVTDAPPD